MGRFRAYPLKLGKPDGRGYVECAASGFLRKPNKVVNDVRQGQVAREFADSTPGFGTHHPQDVKQIGELSDPRPVERSRPPQEPVYRDELGMTDVELEAAIRRGEA